MSWDRADVVKVPGDTGGISLPLSWPLRPTRQQGRHHPDEGCFRHRSAKKAQAEELAETIRRRVGDVHANRASTISCWICHLERLVTRNKKGFNIDRRKSSCTSEDPGEFKSR
jgi:hypothetical protein